MLTGNDFNARMDKKYACWHCPVACGGESYAWDEQENQAKVRIAKREGEIAELRTALAAAADDQKQTIEANIARLTNANAADGKITNDARYPYPHHTHRAEYETTTAFGTMMLNNDLNSLQYANHLCNQYGLDTIAAGSTLAFATECFENGLITKEDTDGIDLRWGNTEAIMAALHKIGTKEGALGEPFGDGVKAAAAKIGRSRWSSRWRSGAELPMHDAKLQPEYFTTYKLDATPARHTQYEAAPRPAWNFVRAPQDRTQATERGKHHKDSSEYMHVVNATGMCQFIMMGAPNDRIPEWINAETGWDTTHEEMRQAGERIANIRMAFNIREGDIPTKRRIPGRLWGASPLEAGPHKDIQLDVKTLEQDFLAACDWDPETAAPSKKKLESLGLGDVAEKIKGARRGRTEVRGQRSEKNQRLRRRGLCCCGALTDSPRAYGSATPRGEGARRTQRERDGRVHDRETSAGRSAEPAHITATPAARTPRTRSRRRA